MTDLQVEALVAGAIILSAVAASAVGRLVEGVARFRRRRR